MQSSGLKTFQHAFKLQLKAVSGLWASLQFYVEVYLAAKLSTLSFAIKYKSSTKADRLVMYSEK